MPQKSKTPFTDKFFQVNRRITYFILGKDQQSLFEHFRDLDLDGGDSYCLFSATGMNTTRTWRIGVFEEPVAVCRRLYPKGTVAVFQGTAPGSRFAMLSVEETDAKLSVRYRNR